MEMIGSQIMRTPRLQIQCTGKLGLEGRVDIRVQDISQRVQKAKTPCSIATGQETLVWLDGLEPTKGHSTLDAA
jgi:hypothetical protein